MEDFQKKLWLKKKFVVETRHTDIQQSLLDAPAAQGADGLKEQYLLRYMLDVETRGIVTRLLSGTLPIPGRRPMTVSGRCL